MALMKGMALVAKPWGGHLRAERTRLVLVREDLAASVEDSSQVQLSSAACFCVHAGSDATCCAAGRRARSERVRQLCIRLCQPPRLPRSNYWHRQAGVSAATCSQGQADQIFAAGIDRGRVGDILVNGERGAHMLVADDIVQYLEDNLTQVLHCNSAVVPGRLSCSQQSMSAQVRQVTVQTREMPLSELRVPVPKVQELTTTEASLRVDAVASAGFRVSRSKMLDAIKGGDVRCVLKLCR